MAVPPLTGRVVDQTGTLSASDIAALTQKLKSLEDSKGSQIAVLLVPTTQPEAIEQFSMRVAEAWKIGRKKVGDGAILVIAKDDRSLRIEVGYGLEGALTDITSRRIIAEDIAPRFKTGDYAGGISAGVDRMIGVINGEPLPPPAPANTPRANALDNFSNPAVLVAVLACAMFFRRLFGRLAGAGVTAGVAGVIAWFLVNSLATALGVGIIAFIFTLFCGAFFSPGGPWRGGGGFGGGGFGGGFGGGGFGGGGFSGGGGGFGGGGASGRW